MKWQWERHLMNMKSRRRSANVLIKRLFCNMLGVANGFVLRGFPMQTVSGHCHNDFTFRYLLNKLQTKIFYCYFSLHLQENELVTETLVVGKNITNHNSARNNNKVLKIRQIKILIQQTIDLNVQIWPLMCKYGTLQLCKMAWYYT